MTEKHEGIQHLNTLCDLPGKTGEWRIQMLETKLWQMPPLAPFAHTGIQVVAPDGQVALEVHGVNRDRKTGEVKSALDEDTLGVLVVNGHWDHFDRQGKETLTRELYKGSFDDIRPRVELLLTAAKALDAAKHPYKSWGMIEPGQNCNTVTRALMRYMGEDPGAGFVTQTTATGATRELHVPSLEAIGQDEHGQIDLSRLSKPDSLAWARKDIARETGVPQEAPSPEGLLAHASPASCGSRIAQQDARARPKPE